MNCNSNSRSWKLGKGGMKIKAKMQMHTGEPFCSFNRNCMGILCEPYILFFFENPESWESVSEKSFRKSALNTQSELFWKTTTIRQTLMRKSESEGDCQLTTPFLFFIVSCLWQFVKYRFDSVVNLMIWNHEGCTQHISIVLLLFEPLSRQLSVFNHKIGRP